MAEAFAALGIAVNVIAVLDVATRVAASAWNIYRSHQRSESLEDAFPAAKSKQLAVELEDALSILKQPTPADCNDEEFRLSAGMQRLADGCSDAADKLLQKLAKMECLDTGRKRDAMKLAVVGFWKKEEIEELESRIGQFRQQLMLQLLVSIRNLASKSSDEIKAITESLRAPKPSLLGTLADRLSFASSRGSPLGPVVLEYVAPRRVETGDQGRGHLESISVSEVVSLCDGLASPMVLTGERSEKTQGAILKWLCPQNFGEREDRVEPAHDATFRWIFEPWMPETPETPVTSALQAHADFRAFLESGKDKLYWVTGKPAAGKSTLMKLIGTHKSPDDPSKPSCHRYLDRWPLGGSSRLVISASFYAWSSGSEANMTRKGLFQTLCYKLLTQRRDLLPRLFPRLWETLYLFSHFSLPHPWGEKEAEALLRSIIDATSDSSKVFLLVDGLDEFSCDHDELAYTMLDLAKSPNVKLCVSSRPWVEFEDAFACRPSLCLQDLTYPDIKAFVSAKLNDTRGFARLSAREPEFASNLIENVAQKSSGVFLWVALVTKSLLVGLKHDDRITDLQRRLDDLPSDLDDLFERIISSLAPFYLSHAKLYFHLMERSGSDRSALLFSFVDERVPSFANKQPIRPLADTELDMRLDTISRRINNRCRGLLEVGRYRTLHPILGCKVQYLHRTVADYLRSPKATKLLAANGTTDASVLEAAPLMLCAAYLSMIKALPGDILIDASTFPKWVSECLKAAAVVSVDHRPQMASLLDELDKVGKFLAKRAAQDGYVGGKGHSNIRLLSEVGLWVLSPKPHLMAGDAALSHPDLFGRTFLSLVVRHGVKGYVKEKATRGCLVQRVGTYTNSASRDVQTRVWPLLLDLLWRVTEKQKLTASPLRGGNGELLAEEAQPTEEVDCELLAELLDHGADPLFKVDWKRLDGKTPLAFVESIPSKNCQTATIMMKQRRSRP